MSTIVYNAPFGPLYITANEGYITGLYFESKEEAVNGAASSGVLERCKQELDGYFAGKLKEFTVPVKTQGTPFRLKVWEALCTIPYGQTISYKQLAERINQPSAIRAVGGANHHNPVSILIPCHRVIGAGGKPVGYGGGISIKEWLLNHEQK
jgi:methylated-DNA-[protein]-cysteine S-methyltransferase